jgi:hypothetical protein
MSALTRTSVGEYAFEPKNIPSPSERHVSADVKAALATAHYEGPAHEEGTTEVIETLGTHRYPVLPWASVTAETVKRVLKNGSSSHRQLVAKTMSQKHSLLRGGFVEATKVGYKGKNFDAKYNREAMGYQGKNFDPTYTQRDGAGSKPDRSSPRDLDEKVSAEPVYEEEGEETASRSGGRWGGFR